MTVNPYRQNRIRLFFIYQKRHQIEVLEDKTPCKNCGYMTNGDFYCFCGEVLCEECSNSEKCWECQDRDFEKKWEQDEYKGDTIG